MNVQSRPFPRPAPAPPALPADIGLVIALRMEIDPFLANLRHVRRYHAARGTVIEGECAGKLVALLIGGVGQNSARRAASLLLAGHRPRWMISAGFAGALDPDLSRNDVVLAHEVRDEPGAVYRVPLALGDDAGKPGQRLRAGRLVTVDRVIRTAAEKQALRAGTGADVLDMETAAVAALCAERNVRFLSVRVVSDDAHADLPPEILTIMGPTGSFRLGAAMGAIWRRPSSFKELLTLRDHAQAAAGRLAEVLPGLLARLP